MGTFLLSLKSLLTAIGISPYSNYYNYSQPLHRPVPRMLHLSDDQATTTLHRRFPRQPSVHALALRPPPEGAPAARTPRAVRYAHCAPAAGSEPLPRLVALPALALAHPLVIALVRLVIPYDAAPVFPIYGHGSGGDCRARKCERPRTRRREPHDAQEGR